MEFQAVAEKTANNFRGLLFIAAPGTVSSSSGSTVIIYKKNPFSLAR